PELDAEFSVSLLVLQIQRNPQVDAEVGRLFRDDQIVTPCQIDHGQGANALGDESLLLGGFLCHRSRLRERMRTSSFLNWGTTSSSRPGPRHERLSDYRGREGTSLGSRKYQPSDFRGLIW